MPSTESIKYAALGREAFEHDELVQVWIVYHLQIIGEAAARLGRRFHEAHPGVPWAQLVAMRNILVHEYFGVSRERVWRTVRQDLPELRRAIQEILNRLESGS